jgi:hypothetical protein
MALLQDWDERVLCDLVVRYVKTFRRLPSHSDLVRFRRARVRLALRIPRQTRRRIPLASTL